MPRTLLVAYDLATPAETRPLIAEQLNALCEAWARPLETVWILRTDLSAEAVEAHIAPLLGADDGLMVQETRGDAVFSNTGLRWFRPRRRAAAELLAQVAMMARTVDPSEPARSLPAAA